MFFQNQNSRTRQRKEKSFLDSVDGLIQHEFEDISNFFRIQKERNRLFRIEQAIELARERGKLKDKIITLSLDEPGFLKELKEILQGLGL